MIHINYPNDKNRIYCRREHKIITLDQAGKFWDICTKCPFFAGDYQGMGVECNWDDPEDNGYTDDPNRELMRVSKLIDEGKIKKEIGKG